MRRGCALASRQRQVECPARCLICRRLGEVARWRRQRQMVAVHIHTDARWREGRWGCVV